MNSFDVLCIGNVNIDVFLQIHHADTHCYLNEKDCELCFPYGQKVLVDSSEFLLGGGASNVSIGLARLGFSSSLIAELGDDEFSQKIFNVLTKEKVDVSRILQTQGAASSFTIGINFKGERTLFVKHVKRMHNFSFNQLNTRWVYVGGLGNEWENAYKKAIEFIKSSNATLVFAPGTTQVKSGSQQIQSILEKTDIFFSNKEEAAKIANFKLPILNNVENLLRELKKTGPKIAVITDGLNGSYVIDKQEKIYFGEASKEKALERTGAGDAYCSGFLAAYMRGLGIETAMKWGTVNAGSVIQKVGAQEGLLTREELEKKVS